MIDFAWELFEKESRSEFVIRQCQKFPVTRQLRFSGIPRYRRFQAKLPDGGLDKGPATAWTRCKTPES